MILAPILRTQLKVVIGGLVEVQAQLLSYHRGEGLYGWRRNVTAPNRRA